jgi:cyclopropane-fatty-acyl-phospholipid synthase
MHDRAAHKQLRAFAWFAQERLSRRLPADAPPFAIQLPGSGQWSFGSGTPKATIVVNSARGLAALLSLDATRLAEAYRKGALEVVGDLQSLLSLRGVFRDRHPLTSVWRYLQPRIFGRIASDTAWIADHYEYPDDFYMRFLDVRHRCYSQAVFASDDEPLEDAQSRKLQFAVDAIRVKPGDRVLDIGGGWGAFTEYGGRLGLRVTSLTLSRASESFIQRLIDAQGLPCRIVREHLFEHQPEQPYDAIVNLGVTEHLPDYPATLARYRRLLKPGGRVYLDASAGRMSRDVSAFLLRHLFPGNGTVLCLHKYLKAVSDTPFAVVNVVNDRHNYLLTARHWAQNLDSNREAIVAVWGEPLYRTFRLYLWGCVDGFTRDIIQAYRLVLELPEGTPGPLH